MSPLYNKETRVKSPPAALRQSVGRPLNAFDGCAWRRPGAVLVLRVPKAASTALTNAMREFRGRYKFVDVAEWPGAVGLTAAPRPPSALAPAVEARMQESKIHRFATGAAATATSCSRATRIQTRYLCGYSTTLCEGPGAVYRAIANVNETVLLTIPAERIDDGGYRALARLLPGLPASNGGGAVEASAQHIRTFSAAVTALSAVGKEICLGVSRARSGDQAYLTLSAYDDAATSFGSFRFEERFTLGADAAPGYGAGDFRGRAAASARTAAGGKARAGSGVLKLVIRHDEPRDDDDDGGDGDDDEDAEAITRASRLTPSSSTTTARRRWRLFYEGAEAQTVAFDTEAAEVGEIVAQPRSGAAAPRPLRLRAATRALPRRLSSILGHAEGREMSFAVAVGELRVSSTADDAEANDGELATELKISSTDFESPLPEDRGGGDDAASIAFQIKQAKAMVRFCDSADAGRSSLCMMGAGGSAAHQRADGPPPPGTDPVFDKMVEDELARRKDQGGAAKPGASAPPVPGEDPVFDAMVKQEMERQKYEVDAFAGALGARDGQARRAEPVAARRLAEGGAGAMARLERDMRAERDAYGAKATAARPSPRAPRPPTAPRPPPATAPALATSGATSSASTPRRCASRWRRRGGACGAATTTGSARAARRRRGALRYGTLRARCPPALAAAPAHGPPPWAHGDVGRDPTSPRPRPRHGDDPGREPA
ncbi:Rad9 [Aureococcus anophagefferens]|nr:Rad9 [Aureococcus anophagefferens]